ncbi:MAG: hypothetical protein HY554_09250 [Elusimicrobia bacterium]|nr:hypothetical protein [Elusimicrobiota bacterium]
MAAAWLALGACAASAGTDVADGVWLAGVDAGAGMAFGPARAALGRPLLLGGQLFYHPRGERGLGLQVDRVFFQPKSGGKATATTLLLASRLNARGAFARYLPYLLLGAGYAESGAEVSGGFTDRGSGLALALGVGVERFSTERFSLGLEARLLRASAPLGRLGVSGATLAALTLRLNAWLGPGRSYF